MASTRWRPAFLILTYPMLAPLARMLPNPMLPEAHLALHMVAIPLVGHLRGPRWGALSGGLGAAIAALLFLDRHDALAIIPHSLAGALAGLEWGGQHRLCPLLALPLAHGLNMLSFLLVGHLPLGSDHAAPILLGLLTECMVGLCVLFMAMRLLAPWRWNEDRW